MKILKTIEMKHKSKNGTTAQLIVILKNTRLHWEDSKDCKRKPICKNTYRPYWLTSEWF